VRVTAPPRDLHRPRSPAGCSDASVRPRPAGPSARARRWSLVPKGAGSRYAPVRRSAGPPGRRAAGSDHPWPDRIGAGRFGGGRLSVRLTRVDPTVVVEISADAALQAGVFRHPLRYVRVRSDLEPADLPAIS
jgi:hypothetical protein